MAAEEVELRRMIVQAKAEENVYEQFEYGECNQFEEPNSKFATSQVNYTLPPHNYIPKPTTVGNGLLDPSESTPEVKSKTIHTSPIVQSTVVNCEPAESLAPKTPSSPKPATTSTSKIEDPSTINPEALPFNPKQDERTGSQVSSNSQPSTEAPGQDIGQTLPLNNSMYDEFLKVQKQASISEIIMVQQVRSSLPSHKQWRSQPDNLVPLCKF